MTQNDLNASNIRQCLDNINADVNELISDNQINCPYLLNLLCNIKKSIITAESATHLIKG